MRVLDREKGKKPCSDGSLPGMLSKQGQNIWRELSKGESVGDGIGEVATSPGHTDLIGT